MSESLSHRLNDYWKMREEGVLIDRITIDSLISDLATAAVDTPVAEIELVAKEVVGIKHDYSKPDFSLLSPIAISYLVAVLDFGAKKYAAHNWRKGLDQTRLIAAALRHLMAYLGGQDTDSETGLPHMAHVMCCAMFSLELAHTHEHLDSRYHFTKEAKDLLESLLAGVVSNKTSETNQKP